MPMLGWLFPACPVSPYEQAWTEMRLAWLIEQFSASRMLAAKVVLPTDEFFPDQYNGSPEYAAKILGRLCGFMQIDPARVTLEVVHDQQLPDAVGHYDRSDPARRPIIRVQAQQLEDPQLLVATLAHELAHELLLGGELMNGDEPDHEWTTDLLPIFLGLGVFLANASLRERSASSGTWSWWTMRRQGYLPARMVGYALAVFLSLRRESRPSWASHLRLDARAALVGGLRYIRRTGDCSLQPEGLHARIKPSRPEIHEQLTRGTPAARILAIWQLDATDIEAIPLLDKLLLHRQRDVRMEAALAMGRFADAAEHYLPHLIDVLNDREPAVRAAACEALSALRLDAENTTFDLGEALDDEYSDVRRAAATALARFGPAAAPAEGAILKALHQALIACNDEMTQRLITALRAASPDAGAGINDYFRERDEELRVAAIDALYRDEHDVIMERDEQNAPAQDDTQPASD